ncbi:response regulator transcription factor [Piscibacillus halophilus]|uniref:DNA-binding response regulator, OmpR family, contains REC and winged-helix (WHTH) domain n=1 Tax=Piscibacillus halophilus TaxID=571933 RepID=A0A1H9GZ41_9BACI|nr:response regulator transcription factor [Piscibacillus halophilus]SEQ55268.1 DNA-binding response regulator, OmpR family, contains REC and winged-helix (wHTH) domain [Piscibacillus halophilus]
MSDTSILVIEDEEKIARVLELELGYEGYTVSKAHSGYDALELYRSQTWDLILLDIMLPEMSGIELLRRIRKNDTHTPILLLTAKGSTEDKVTGLDLGANDYITKPFEIEELLARIRAALRQVQTNQVEAEDEWLSFENLKLNQTTREVYRGERFIELTPREFDLLVYFLNHKRQVLTRDQILDQVWGFDYVGDTNVVDVYVRYLRKKIDAEQDHDLIHTVRGVGYVLKDAYETKK